MVIAACVAGGFSCTDDVIEDLFSVLRLGQHCSLIGDFREYGSQNSGSCRSSRLGDRGGGRAVEEILLAAGETSFKPSTLLGRREAKGREGERSSILAGFLLAHIFEQLAILRASLLFRLRVAIFNSMLLPLKCSYR